MVLILGMLCQDEEFDDLTISHPELSNSAAWIRKNDRCYFKIVIPGCLLLQESERHLLRLEHTCRL